MNLVIEKCKCSYNYLYLDFTLILLYNSPENDKKAYLDYCVFHGLEPKSLRSLFNNKWLSSDLLTKYIENFISVNSINAKLIYSFKCSEIFDKNFIYSSIAEDKVDKTLKRRKQVI